MADLERRVPRGEHREVVVIEFVDGLGVVSLELVLRYLVHPRAHDLAEKLAARLTADRLRDHADGFLWLDEAERHRGPLLPWWSGGRNCVEGTWEGGRKSGPADRPGGPVEIYAGEASSRATRSSSRSSCKPCPTASSSPAANSIRPFPSWHSSSVSRRPAWFESSRRMISSSRSTAASYVIDSALMCFLHVSYFRSNSSVRQPNAEPARLADGRGRCQRLPAFIRQQRVAALQCALRVVSAERRRLRRQRGRAPLLPALACTLERSRPHADRAPARRDGHGRRIAPPLDHSRRDAALELDSPGAAAVRRGPHLAGQLVEPHPMAGEMIPRGA